MKVSELIAKLQQVDPDHEVVVTADGGQGYVADVLSQHEYTVGDVNIDLAGPGDTPTVSLWLEELEADFDWL
ncbi:MAG TPA: hypothetical protein VH681_14495, partial [Nitrospiraceae bacterium]